MENVVYKCDYYDYRDAKSENDIQYSCDNYGYNDDNNNDVYSENSNNNIKIIEQRNKFENKNTLQKKTKK